MGIETPRLTSVVPSSPRHLLQKNLVVSTPRNTAHGQGEKRTQAEDQPQRKAATQLTIHLKQLQDKSTSGRPRTRPLRDIPPLQISRLSLRPNSHTSHGSHVESSQEQIPPGDPGQEQPLLDASEGASLSERGTPPSHVQGVQHSPKPFVVNTRVPIGSTVAELRNVVHHRKEYTDKKKQIGLAGWGAGLTVEGITALGSSVAVPLVSVAAIGAWTSLTSIGPWVGGLYDRYEASGSRKLSRQDYEKAKTLRADAMRDRVVLAMALVEEGRLEEGKALLAAAREMVVMLDEVLKGPEGYLAPTEAELRAKRRTLELQSNDELIEMLKVGPDDESYKQHEAKHLQLNDRISCMRVDKSARREDLKKLKAKLGDLTGLERDEAQEDIDRLELIAKQKKYPRLLRNPKHLGHRRLKLDRDKLLVDIRMPPDILATLTTFTGTLLGITATGFVAPAVTILMSPFWMRSARLDLEDAFRERLTADASLKTILDKLALGRAMQAHFDDLPHDQQNDPQTRLGKSIARNLISAALREYKQAMRLKNLSVKKELKGAGLRYAAIPALVVLAGGAIAATVLGIATGGIAFGVAAAATGIGVGAYYLYLSRLKKKAKTDKHEAKRRQAAALWVKDQIGDVRLLLTSDGTTAKAIVSDLQRQAPDTLLPYLHVDALLYQNEHLMSMALSEEYTHAPTYPAAAPGSAPFAVQMTKPLGLSDDRSNFLRHNGPLLAGEDQQAKVALATLTPLFAGAKVYDNDRLPYQAPSQATDAQLNAAVHVLDSLATSKQYERLVDLIARMESPDHIQRWARQDPANARFMRQAMADLRTALIDQGVSPGHLAELQDRLKHQEDLPPPDEDDFMGQDAAELPAPILTPLPASLGLLNVLLEWKDAGLEGTQEAEDLTRPPVGVPQFEEAIRQLGTAQKSARQQKRLEKGQLLLAGGRSVRTPKQWLRYFDKKPGEKDTQIENLISMWRDALPRNPQGQIDVPDSYASENDYLVHLMKETIAQYRALRKSVATHASHEESKMLDTLQERFDSSTELAQECLKELQRKHPKAQQALAVPDAPASHSHGATGSGVPHAAWDNLHAIPV